MKGHGYLYAILAGMADRFEGQAEQQHEQALRTGPRAATVKPQERGRPGAGTGARRSAPRPAPAAPAPAGMSPHGPRHARRNRTQEGTQQ